MDLEDLREDINDIDRELMMLFEKRMETVLKIAQYKKDNCIDIEDTGREMQVIERNIENLNDETLQVYAEAFLMRLIEISKAYQQDFMEIGY